MRSARKGGVAAPERSRNGLFAFLGRTPRDSRGRKWGRSEGNREPGTPQGNGAVPYVTWWAGLYVEARGLRRGTTA